ncbi:MAG TPA: hypothetical protein H9902_12745 [Candidatus Stackebrandtia faecavium]|nr:hypothetical protein [Candidatus Stackebrandtia faecavium]
MTDNTPEEVTDETAFEDEATGTSSNRNVLRTIGLTGASLLAVGGTVAATAVAKRRATASKSWRQKLPWAGGKKLPWQRK